MRKLLVAVTTIFFFNTVSGQIQTIVDTTIAIEGRMSNSFYQQSSDQSAEISSILNTDVFKYYNLKDQYNTELKKKNYKSTADYQEKLNDLKSLKKELCSKTYYLDFDPFYYEKNNTFKYNLNTRTFTLTNVIYKDEMYNGANIIQFDNIILSLVKGISIRRETYSSGGVDFIRQKIDFKISDEQVAEIIEENRSDIKILFVFRFTNALNYPGKFFGSSVTVPGMNGKLLKVIMYDSTNGKIYKIYK